MITLDSKLFWSAYKEANDKDEVQVLESILPSLKEWLVKNIEFKELLDLILEYPFVDSIQLCCNDFYGPEGIKENTEMFKLIKDSYVVVGSAPNGDWIAIPRNKWDSIGYISHDEFGYDDSDELNYCAVSNSIGEFFYNTWKVKNYPCDYYEAIEYKEKNG